MPRESSYQQLSDERITEIVRGARNHKNRQHVPWFYRGEVLSLIGKAIKTKKDRVIIDGRSFDVQYREGGKKAVIRPSDGAFVPIAYINVDSYLREHEAYERAFGVTRLDSAGTTS